MAIAVFRAFSIVDDELVGETSLPRRCSFRRGDVIAAFTNLRERGSGDGPALQLDIVVGEGPAARRIRMSLPRFLTGEEYRRSLAAPFPFCELGVQVTSNAWKPQDGRLAWLWLFRDAVYVTERTPQPTEMEEVVLRIKSLHFQGDEALKRLREQVSNFEAIESAFKGSAHLRKPIPDDVKLLVWTRDGGKCVKCGGQQELHFDHIIPYSRGGSNEAENIQLLCRTCNLAKSDRLV